MKSLLFNAIVCFFLAISSISSAGKVRLRLNAPVTPLEYSQLGFKKLGSGYWRKGGDYGNYVYFYANKQQKKPKSWTKLVHGELKELVHGELKVLGAGYAVVRNGKAFFKGEEFLVQDPSCRTPRVGPLV